ncbi:hypothetical protein JCM24511_09903 [Saitozyma sp. JCM 24511]|nr:hypothetical protein JCM24511_09903 [Saitozyma sp. JCM 24511]
MSAQVEEKPELSQLEVAMDLERVDNEGHSPRAHMGDGLVKSRFDDLSLGKACWTFRKALFYCFVAYTSSVMEGFVLTMSGSIIANQGFINQFGETQPDGSKVLNTSWVSAWGAIINVGQIIAMTYVPFMTDRFGRKLGFYSCWLLYTAFLGKLLFGIGVGTAQILTTPYVMEIAPTRVRGGIIGGGLIWQVVPNARARRTTIGGILCSLMLQISNQRYPLRYLLPIYVIWGPIASLLLCFFVLPESPWFHARRDNKEASIKSLRRLYQGIPGYDFEEEYGIIRRSLEHEKLQDGEARSLTWKTVFTGLNRKRLTVMIALCCSQQLGGVTLIYSYSTYFFQLAGLQDPFLASLVQNLIGLAAVIVFTFTVDKIGRRPILCPSYTIMSGILWVIGGVYYAGSAASQRVLLALVCIWQPAFTVFGNSYFLLASELPTAQLRMKANAASWVTQAVLGIATNFAVPPLLTHLGIRAAFVFGATSLPFMIFFWYFLPETKGRSVSEIDELYEQHVPAWRWAKYETEAERQMRAVVAGSRLTKPVSV